MKREPYYEKVASLIGDYTPLRDHLGYPVNIGWVARGVRSSTRIAPDHVVLDLSVRGARDKGRVIAEVHRTDNSK